MIGSQCRSRLTIRLATGVTFILFLAIFSQLFERRRVSYSCRTFSSCLGFGSRRQYVFTPSSTTSELVAVERTLQDGTIYFGRETVDANRQTLVLALNRDADSWSHDFRETRRTAYDFLELLASTQLDLTAVSLAIMTASLDEYEKLKSAIETYPFASVKLYYRFEEPIPGLTYEVRHDPRAQLLRRAAIAKARNYLMSRALDDEKHIIWLDGDVVELSTSIVQTMIQHSETNADVGIITARCRQNKLENYDQNSWRLNDPRLMDTIWDNDREGATQGLVETRLMVPKLIKNTADTDLVPLDSVGGTILYMRAELVRLGASFPHFNVVGTTWNHFGWVGIETEGLCYMARGLKGGGCFVLGGKHLVRHSDWG